MTANGPQLAELLPLHQRSGSSVTDVVLIKQIDLKNQLGEGVIWDARHNTLWWIDILSNQLFCWPEGEDVVTYRTPFQLCSFGLTQNPATLVAAFDSGFALYTPASGHVEWLYNVEEHMAGTRLNDGKVDRSGYFWAGSMATNESDAIGALYKLNQGNCEQIKADITISNGLSWNQSGTRVYHADSPTRTIHVASIEPNSGTIGPWECFVKTNKGAYPDGACVDSQDCLWSAQWGSSKIKRYDPQGEEIFSLDVPCKQPSCVAFGGKNLDLLFVTSAAVGLENSESDDQNVDGSLLVYQTPFCGVKEPICIHH